mgnify:CR=1 FL=1
MTELKDSKTLDNLKAAFEVRAKQIEGIYTLHKKQM